MTAPTGENLAPYLTGFLAVLSVIWMVSSTSYLSLTSEWKRTEFERCQGLMMGPYVMAKSSS